MAPDLTDSDRERLRTLMKEYRIMFKDPMKSNEWPSAHKGNFENIRKIRDQKFDSFCANIDIRSTDEPWRERTKYRAEWLAKRACRLFNQQRNEAGWRFGLENDVLRRFSVEVACPKCRARIWRSEIEATINQSNDLGDHLDERRKIRVPCRCPPKDRPQDYYEIGTNPLFDDRVQAKILYDPLLRSILPVKEPDRVYGLAATDNLEKLLSTRVPSVSADGNPTTLGKIVRSCPFKGNPLYFPFLILEAKSEKSKDGFDDILTQTAFPILALLKLQAELHDQVPGQEENDPLVWFFANRGDAWRVYGCCVTGGNPAGYNIFQLWDGSIMSKDNALQLLLIVDYIFDWARDIYRPSILRQLKSLATGKAYDQVSLTDDSDIESILNWIQPPPSTIGGFDLSQDLNQPTVSLDHQSLPDMFIPNTQLGTLRSACLIDSRVNGLYITEHNVRQLLQLVGSTITKTEKVARKLVNFLTRWDELFLLTGEDLDDLEETWTGDSRPVGEESTSSRNAKFYVVMEMKTFINGSWNLVREFTYLAVSKPAFEILVEYANFRVEHLGIRSISRKSRSCTKKVLGEGISCLRSGSPSQLFLMATACTSLSLYQLPERERTDYTPPTEALGLGLVQRPRLPEFVNNFHKFGQPKKAAKRINNPASLTPEQHRHPEPVDLTFLRRSERRDRLSEDEYHETTLCERCRRSGHDIEREDHLGHRTQEVFSAYGMSLVISVDMVKHREDRHDICVFAVDGVCNIDNHKALSVIVEDLFQSGFLYHTIRHPIASDMSYRLHQYDTLWNLPLPYRPATAKERKDIFDWLAELEGNYIPISGTEIAHQCWDGLQLLIHFLKDGKAWELANQQVELYRREGRDRIGLFERIIQEKDDKRREAGENRRRFLELSTTPLCAKGN